MKKAFSTAVLLVLAIGWGMSATPAEAPEAPAPAAAEAPQNAPEPRATRLLFAGDVMLSRAIDKTVRARGGDWSYPYALMGDAVKGADVAFANLETPVSLRGTNMGSIYSFRTDPAALTALKEAGIDVVSIANNHMWDYGRDAFLDTREHLASAGILFAGGGRDYAEAHAPALVEANGLTFAFLAYTDLLPGFLLRASSSPAVAFPTEGALREDIARAKKLGADVVIASFHWGEEYKREHNARQEALAKAAIDAGAGIVMGHHPHTPQEIERYKDGLIIYSLGNFIFDQNFDEFTRKGILVSVTINPDGSIGEAESLEIRFNSSYQPYAKER